LFALGQIRLAAPCFLKGKHIVFPLVDRQKTFHGQVHDCGSKCFVVEVHSYDKTNRGWREPFRGGEKRDNGSLGRIPTDPEPNQEIIGKEGEHACQPGNHAPVVPQDIASLIQKCWLGHDTLGPGYGNGQALPRHKGPGRCESQAAALVRTDGVISAFFPMASRVGGFVLNLSPRRKLNHGLDTINDEVPTIPGDVPIEFVKILKKTELAASFVNNTVRVGPRPQQSVLLANVDSLSVWGPLDVIGFGTAVPLDVDDLKTHVDRISVTVFVFRWKLTKNPPLDLLSLASHPDGFFNGHASIRMDLDPASEIEQPFRGPRETGSGRAQEHDEESQNSKGQESLPVHGWTVVFHSWEDFHHLALRETRQFLLKTEPLVPPSQHRLRFRKIRHG